MESDLRDIENWDRKCLADFSAGKFQLVLFDQSDNSCALDVNMDGFVLMGK